MREDLIKIAVVGPESTGKSSVATWLSEQMNTVCIPEYSRYYCQNLNRQYTLEDEVNMFHGQIALEEALIPLAKNNTIITDTTILTVKIWCDKLFQHTPDFIVQEIKNRTYDFYLLMDIDLPWEDDPLRDFPHEREYFLNVWKEELSALQANYKIVSGIGEDRYKNALKALKEYY